MMCKLSDICEFVKGKVDVSSLTKTNYISTENILPNRGGIVEAASLPSVDTTQMYSVGDILVSNIRPYFKKIWFANTDGGCSNDVLVFRAKTNVNPIYLYYILSGDKFFNYVTATSKGTKMPRGDKIAIMNYEVEKHTRTEQDTIASILKPLDDKIELNNKINNNLLDQIEALYHAWFVDYLPFDGQQPIDWRKSDIYSIANIIYGAPFASKQFNTEGEGKPIIRIRDLKDQHFETYTTEIHPKGYLLNAGDIVVGMDGEFRPYIWGNDEAWLNQRVCVFENKRLNGKAFLYCTIKPLLYRIEQIQVGTTVIHIGKKDFDAFEIILPSQEIMDRFDETTMPMFNQIVANCFETRKLTLLRDALLPKLMSGALDVSEIEI